MDRIEGYFESGPIPWSWYRFQVRWWAGHPQHLTVRRIDGHGVFIEELERTVYAGDDLGHALAGIFPINTGSFRTLGRPSLLDFPSPIQRHFRREESNPQL